MALTLYFLKRCNNKNKTIVSLQASKVLFVFCICIYKIPKHILKSDKIKLFTKIWQCLTVYNNL